ncbi:Hsp20/alpha crystallin family protein [Actinomadura hibisca]|uniref:Hsp20/alpha crystallin family protein n=1 Tax=Actinomadura hibisca TaxID=68565 RepID=UPI000835BEEF|nr:Hsp20/alpha crystallin family protein [Actinomadura hibisca]
MITAPRLRPPREVARRLVRSAPIARLRQAGGRIRAEDYVEDGRYVVRADLPGMDPDRDIAVSVRRDTIEIKAIRRDQHRGGHTGEISYGLFRRVVTLPRDADRDTLTTRYADGVLEVAVALSGARLRAVPHGR